MSTDTVEIKEAVKAAEDHEKELDIVQPSAEPKQWVFGTDPERQLEYWQKPLTFMNKMRLFALTGATIRSALAAGGDGTLSDLLNGSGVRNVQGAFSSGDLNDAESFIALVSGFLVYVPDFLEDAYCLLLNVPIEQRSVVKHYMSLDKEQGGLSDEDGIEIINIAIAQNWEAIRRFLGVELRNTLKLIQTNQKKEEEEQEKLES